MIKKILFWFFMAIILIIGVFYINLKVYMKKGERVTMGNPIEKYDSSRSALLVLDIQEYTTGELSGNEIYRREANGLIQKINRMAVKSSESGIPVIYIRSEISNPLINMMNNSLAPGSAGGQLDKRLRIVSDHILPKEKQDAFSNDLLDSILIANEISRLFVVGLDAANCVNSTIQGAMNRGYEISVISDAVISDPDSVRFRMFKEFDKKGAEILDTQDYLSLLQ